MILKNKKIKKMLLICSILCLNCYLFEPARSRPICCLGRSALSPDLSNLAGPGPSSNGTRFSLPEKGKIIKRKMFVSTCVV